MVYQMVTQMVFIKRMNDPDRIGHMIETTTEVTTETATDHLRQSSDPSIVICDGYDVKLCIRRGQLQITDGVRTGRRVRTIARTDGIKRIIMLSESGMITLEAVHWMDALGIVLAQFDRDGRAMLTSPGMNGDARLRASQALAQLNPSIARAIILELISAKMTGQAETAREVLRSAETADRITRQVKRIADAESIADILAAEGSASAGYWKAWKDRVSVPFPPEQLAMVLPAWYGFQTRTSLKSPLRQGKEATDPVNAMLNYAYSIAETEARIACNIFGLDPALGFAHGQHRKMDSLAFDILEPLRPLVDRVVLGMMDTGHGLPLDPDTGQLAYIKARHFSETSQGVCRIVAPLTHVISSRVTAAVANDAGQYAERIARLLAKESQWNVTNVPYASKPEAMPKPVNRNIKLAPELSPNALISDELWSRITPLIPAEPMRQDGRHKTERANNRIILAAIIAHLNHGIAWKAMPDAFGISWNTPRRRLMEWQELGCWDAIQKEIAKPRMSRDREC